MDQGFLIVEIRIAIQGLDSHCFPVYVCYLLNYLLKLTFSLVPSPLLLLASVALKYLH
jgi:hypothetical protein